MNTVTARTNPSALHNRNVACLDLNGRFADQFGALAFSGWRVSNFTSMDEARQAADAGRYHVGMVYLNQLSEQQLDQVFDLTHKGGGAEWIALVTERELADRDYCTMIHENFFDYFTLPVERNLEYLRATLGHAFGISALREKTRQQQVGVSEMVGTSPSIRAVFNQIRKVADVDASVLITGETGTGKEMVARAIHQRSGRREGPFVAINCGALPETLIHSELFGHERGAFTGAHKRNIGHFEAADRGTIFLDEIGDLPLQMQVYLLRFLEEHHIQRLGSSDTHSVDTRVLAATHVDLDKAVREGRFREDLYYRLNVVNIHLPSLTERIEDVGLLASYFSKHFAHEYQIPAKSFTKQALAAMMEHRWPGNVREMINRIRRALIMSDGRQISASDLGLAETAGCSELIQPLEAVRELAEQQAIERTLRFVDGNVSRAAQLLGVSRVTLYRLIEKHAIR